MVYSASMPYFTSVATRTLRQAYLKTNWVSSLRFFRSRSSFLQNVATDADPQHDSTVLFRYTSGRWLWNEAEKIRARYQPFDIEQLKVVAAEAAGARSCVSMIKLPEGAYNRCFEMRMDNKVLMIARLPGPNLTPRIVTASEVATLDFLRAELHVPVPKVLAWNSDKNNEVGAEYIIMEKARGLELWKVWASLSVSEKINVTLEMVDIQASLDSVDFPAYGSLYNRGFHPEGSIDSGYDRFCIGPSIEDHFWKAERKELEICRGPWKTPSAYMKDTISCAIEWISKYAKPRSRSDPLRQSDNQESPECHLEALSKAENIAASIVPANKQLHRSAISHPDLHGGNIFVDKGRISCIIDWQGTCALPLFLSSRMPKFLRMERPLLFELPPATGMTSQEKKDTLAQYQTTQLQQVYVRKLNQLSNAAFLALSNPHTILRQRLVDFSSSTWDDDGLFLLREMLHQISRDWEEITDQTRRACPISISEAEFKLHAEESRDWNDFKQFFRALHIPMDGWVSNDEFEEKAAVMRSFADDFVASSENKSVALDAMRAWRLTASGDGSRAGDVVKFE